MARRLLDHAPIHADSRLAALLSSADISCTGACCAPLAVLFSQGEPSDRVLYLEAGLVRLDVLAPNGTRAVAGLLNAGAFLGEEALAGQPVRRHTAIAMCDSEVLAVGKADMLRALRTAPAVADLFLSHVLVREADLQTDLADQLLHSGAQRLARLLLRLAGDDRRTGGRREVPHVSQEIVAEMIGTTRSRVNLLLATLRKRALIESRDGTLYVTPRLDQWVALAGDDCAIRRGSAAATSVRLVLSGRTNVRSALG